ncbi:hypothetical protein DFJ73DRAFT_583884 [Zopfochytrium polystomum]|nr:hypothetical protein DFJ73DRAFT_583884 [Zopfochytrium polystomum]
MPQRSVSPRLARSQDALLLPTLNQPSSTNGGASLRSIFGFRKLSSPTSPDALQPLGAPTPRAQLPPPAWLQWDPSMLTPELQSKYYLSSSEYGSIGELPGHRSSDRRSLFLFQASAESSSERRQPSMWMKSQIGEDSFPTPLPPPPSKSTSPTPSPQLASRVFEKCIKVHSFNGQSHVLDVKMLNTGVSIREAIFRKFRITPEMRPFYALYKLDDRGKVDVGRH